MIAKLFLLFAVSVVTAILVNASNRYKKVHENTTIEQCFTRDCIITAGTILDTIDTSFSPCENFYDFVCNNYVEQVPLLEDLEKTLYTTRYEEYLAELNVILSSGPKEDEQSDHTKIKQAYMACLTDSVEDQIQSLSEFLDKIGGWPLMLEDGWNNTNFNWLEMTYKAIHYGLLDAAVIAPSKKTEATHPKFSLEINSEANKVIMLLHDSDRFDKSFSFVEDLVQQMGVDRNLSKDLQQIYSFAKTVDEIIEHNSEEMNIMTVTSLEGTLPMINWRQFLKRVYQTTVNDQDNVWIQSFGLFKELVILMETTDNRVLANWFVTKIVISMFLNNIFPPEIKDILKPTEIDDTYQASRVRYCLHFAYHLAPLTVRKMHSEKYFTLEDKREVKQMEAYVRVELRKQIENGYIFAEDFANMSARLLKPENTLDGIDILDPLSTDPNELSEVIIDTQHHLSNALLLGTLQYKKLSQRNQYTKHNLDLFSLFFEYPVFQMDFATNKSTLYVPASLLRGLFFSNNRPKYLNYGILGFSIAEQMFSKLDANEFLDDVKLHQECIQNQYINSTFEDTSELKTKAPLRKAITTIANDQWGLHLAYAAYKQASHWIGTEPTLPGINMTSEQLFWVSYAMSLCQTYDDEEMINNAVVLGRTRVLHTVPNLPQFAESFKCPTGSAMNADKRCLLPL